MSALILLFACIIFLSQYDRCEGGFAASDLKMCSSKDSNIYLSNMQLRMVEEAQELKMDVFLKEDVSNGLNIKIELQRYFGDKARTITTMKKKGACDALQTYGGETYLDGAKQAKIPNYDKCPIRKGRYSLDWYRIDFNKIPIIRIVPHGKFKVILNLYLDSFKTTVFCVEFNVEKD